MGKNANTVRVALTGSIWVGDDTATMPADVSASPGAGWVDLGYTTTAGVTFKVGREIENIDGWQSLEPLRKIITGSPKSCSFTLRQLERATWLATMGGSVTTAAGKHRWVPDESTIAVRKLLVEIEDGDITTRIGFHRASQIGEVEFSLVRSDAVNLPNEWECLAPPSGAASSWFLDTDDPAFAEA